MLCLCRSLCFKCVNQLVVSFLVRHGGSTQTVVWLDKVTKPLIANARKGGIPTQEQQVRIVLASHGAAIA